MDALTQATDAALTSAQVNGVLHSLIIDGVFNGVGTVLSFLPIILVLFQCAVAWNCAFLVHGIGLLLGFT